MLAIWVIGIALLAVLITYGYYRRRVLSAMTIEQMRANERQLRGEINTLQNQLYRSSEDPVTKLLAWEFFEDRVTQHIKESERYQLTMGLMFVDVDEFEVIVDALNEEIGDKLLAEVARRLEHCVRQVDSISRVIKDTFVILLAQLTKPETAAIISQRILQELSQPFQIDDHELYITACIGISLYPNDGTTTQELLKNASHALHLAKKDGKNTSKFYQERMHLQSQRDLLIYNCLNRESIYKEFVLYFQPIVDVSTKSVFGVDVSLSWNQPELGVISTQELFGYAEKQRKLNILSGWLLKNACKQFLEWRDQGFSPAFLAIPLSIKQLENSQFVYQLSQILQELHFNPACLLIEIKESWFQESMEILEKAFNMLSYLKVNLALDDFGSGSFALRYLKNGAIKYLKLSPALVDDVVENEQTRVLIQSILHFGGTMGIQVVVQGVESEVQMDVLKKMGCTLVQGSYIGAPLTAQALLQKIAIPIT